MNGLSSALACRDQSIWLFISRSGGLHTPHTHSRCLRSANRRRSDKKCRVERAVRVSRLYHPTIAAAGILGAGSAERQQKKQCSSFCSLCMGMTTDTEKRSAFSMSTFYKLVARRGVRDQAGIHPSPKNEMSEIFPGSFRSFRSTRFCRCRVEYGAPCANAPYAKHAALPETFLVLHVHGVPPLFSSAFPAAGGCCVHPLSVFLPARPQLRNGRERDAMMLVRGRSKRCVVLLAKR